WKYDTETKGYVSADSGDVSRSDLHDLQHVFRYPGLWHPCTGSNNRCPGSSCGTIPKPAAICPTHATRPNESKRPTHATRPNESKRPTHATRPNESKRPTHATRPNESKRPTH